MKRIYDFITKANQVLFFVALVAAILGIGSLVLWNFGTHYQPPHVAVAQTPEQVKKIVIEDVRYLGQASGIYLLGVVKREVASPDQAPMDRFATQRKFSSYSGRDEGGLVNIIFSKGGKKIKTLLPHDGLVVSHTICGDLGQQHLKSHLFLCVTEDTDGNHILDQMDRNDLYIVAEDLQTPDLIMKGVLDHQVLMNSSHLMVKTGVPSDAVFWDVDTATHERQEVSWK